MTLDYQNIYRHFESGKVYELIGRAELNLEPHKKKYKNLSSIRNSYVIENEIQDIYAIYRDMDTKDVFVMPYIEFIGATYDEDGDCVFRFDRLEAMFIRADD